eukprot:scaffold102609_cov63-Phaeocystis_antarctica.AAC.1
MGNVNSPCSSVDLAQCVDTPPQASLLQSQSCSCLGTKAQTDASHGACQVSWGHAGSLHRGGRRRAQGV